MAVPIVVTGGTGTIGRRVVPRLVAGGRSVRIATRHPGADTVGVHHVRADSVAGSGLADAFRGAEVVLHLAGGARGDDVAARHVAQAARSAGVRHLLLISVVGADSMPIGYFRAKAAAEEAVASSGVPWTVLRVAQLHDFVLPIVRGLARLPITPVPAGLRFEPVDGDEVAARLVELTLGDAVGRATDLAGPEVLDLGALVAALLATRARSRRTVGVPLPGKVGRAYGDGDNLAGPSALRGTRTWKEYVTERPAVGAAR